MTIKNNISSSSSNTAWEKTYKAGKEQNHYPYDSFVSRVYKYISGISRNNFRILEEGCVVLVIIYGSPLEKALRFLELIRVNQL